MSKFKVGQRVTSERQDYWLSRCSGIITKIVSGEHYLSDFQGFDLDSSGYENIPFKEKELILVIPRKWGDVLK